MVGAGAMGLYGRDNPVQLCIAVWRWGAYLGDEGLEPVRAPPRVRTALAGPIDQQAARDGESPGRDLGAGDEVPAASVDVQHRQSFSVANSECRSGRPTSGSALRRSMQRIRDAGVEHGVFPIHADARSLPW